MEKGQSKNSLLIFVGIVIAGLLIAASIYLSVNNKGKSLENSPNIKGDANGKDGIEGNTQADKRINLAKAIGLDEEKFKECVDKADVTEINKDLEDAKKYGATGTPAFFIGKLNDNNEIEAQKVVGAQPYEVFKQVLDSWVIDGKPLNTDQIPENYLSKDTISVSLDDDPIKGNNEASIAIVEFSDYECPFCKRYVATTYRQIIKDYIDNGNVKYVFRDLPLSFHNPVAMDVAVATNCARELGGDDKYYEYHDRYFENTKGNAKGL